MTLKNSFDEKSWTILEARAKRAQTGLQAEDVTDLLEVLLIQVQQMRVAVPATTIVAVQELQNIVGLPGAPVRIAGLVNWRGQLLTVLDLAALLQQPADEEASSMIVVATGEMTVGLRVTEVMDITHVRRSELLSATSNLDTPHAAFYMGLLPDSTAILNIDLLLNDPALLVQDTE